MHRLTYDSKFNVWVDPAGQIDYSDGAQTEDRILAGIVNSGDRSLFSEELHRQIVDWPTEYHFTWERASILRPVPIGRDARVLEIGAGFGAITRYLGETGANVVAVEGGLPRARGAGTRCADLPNVKVCAADFNNLDFGAERFDLITLIGVFEYTAKYSAEAEPYHHMLERCRALLAHGGRLVIAIENLLGFKYLVGYEEDHLGTVHGGVAGLYKARGVRTFGRDELERMLGESGFDHVDFLYPFPDYKLPRVIVGEAGLVDKEFRAADLLLGTRSRNYSGKRSPEVSESLSFHGLQRNGLMGDLANSFLIVASQTAPVPVTANVPLAWVFSSERRAPYAVETTFVRTVPGRPSQVRKARMQPQVPVPSALIVHSPPAQADYVVGENLAGILERLLAGNEIEAFVAALIDWAQHVKQAETRAGGPGAPGTAALFDALPRNWIRCPDGSLHLIDLEWHAKGPVSTRSVVIRYGLVEHAALANKPDSKVEALELVNRVMAAIGEPAAGLEEWERTNQAGRAIGDQVYFSALREWRFNCTSQSKERPGSEAIGRPALPWLSDTLLGFGSIRVELCLPPALYERTSTDKQFLLGKTRPMVESLFAEIGDREVRRAVALGVIKGGEIVILNERLRPAKLVAIGASNEDVPPLSRYAATQPDGRVRWYRGVRQVDKEKLGQICLKEFGGSAPDLVIDNASHLYRDTRAAFHALFPRLRPGGLYIVDSWAWAHWPGDFWQKERGGDFFRNEPPLSNLLIELMLASAGAPDIIRNVKFDSLAIYIERGGGAVEPGFDLAQLSYNRGEPVPRISGKS